MEYIKILSDECSAFGKVFRVIQYRNRINSTGVDLVVEDTQTKETLKLTVASHQIEWLEAKDW